jgi:hypothetical protein
MEVYERKVEFCGFVVFKLKIGYVAEQLSWFEWKKMDDDGEP